MKRTLLLWLSGLLILTACHTNNGQTAGDIQPGKQYAKGFTIKNTQHYTTVIVFNPWKSNEIYAKYYLVRNNSTAVPKDGIKVKIPVKRLVANSATYFEPLKEIGCLDVVVGTCSARYIYSPEILSGVKSGHIKDLGDSNNLNFEQTLALKPEGIMTTSYNADNINVKRFTQSGIPVFYNFEWMEETPLGRAEWIKFIAAFEDKQNVANRLFSDIVKNYNEAKAVAAKAKNAPSILVGEDFRSSWSMPGGHSFNARLIYDAKGSYYFASDTTTGSINFTIEKALVQFGKAQIWIATQENTLHDLQEKNPQYALFTAFKNRQVYNWNNRMNVTGGNDYWESAVVHPDILLKDLIKTLHPTLLPGYKPIYLKRLT